MGLLVKGVPKAKAYTTSSGTAEANIEVLVTEFNILTSPTKIKAVETGRYKNRNQDKKSCARGRTAQ